MYGDRRRSNFTAILFAACLVSAAILFAPRGGAPEPPVHPKVVRQQVAAQLLDSLKGKHTIDGAERELKRIQFTDVRFSRSFDRLLIEFDLVYEPALTLRGTCILQDDGFGRYRGEWNDGRFRVVLFVK
jgi:hypothetical protein